MKKKNIFSVIVATLMASASAQTTPIDFNQLATNCQLVVEKNNQKNQKQQELSDLTAELETYKQMWWDICYAAMEDPNTSKEEIQYLIDNTYSDIDNSQLLADLNKSLQGKHVTRQTMPQQPEVTEPAKMDPTKKVNDPDKTVKEEKKEDKTTLRPDELVKKKKKNNNN